MERTRLCVCVFVCIGAASLLASCSSMSEPDAAWTTMLDASQQASWAQTEFGGEGPVSIDRDEIILEPGSPMTGVHWTGAFPRLDYEFEVLATRIDGSDFFCGLTFPVADDSLSFILGGWGGSLVGISNLDGKDASENFTKRILELDDGRRYRVHIRVTEEEIAVKLDGERLFAFDPREHRLGIRPEVAPSKPLGIACFATTARLEKPRWRSTK